MADIAAVTFLLENLISFLKENVDLLKNAKDELKGLENELQRMKAIMVDASKMQNQEEHFKESMRQMREFIYEVEDTIDSCTTSSTNKFFAPMKLNQTKMVKELRTKANTVFDLVTKAISTTNTEGSSNIGAQGTKSLRIKTPREENVVGLEEQTEALINGITDKTIQKFDVFSIIGMPGLGKTTLAWRVYRNKDIEYEFATLIWVYLSQNINMRNVLLTILKKFDQNIDMSKETIDELAVIVRKKLERAKFLLFIDDVWTLDAWEQIEKFLPKNNTAGRVLITTRDENVAKRASRERKPHQLEFLSPEKSLELLRLEIYNTPDQEFPFGLENTAKLIARKCGGLPLAIIVIGGMLAGESSSSEWIRISEDVGRQLIEKDPESNLENMVLLSYKILPYDLRNCFLYLGMFPEDAEIPALKLTQLWIAEGFITETSERSLERTAQDNLKDLISRNLMKVEKTKLNGEVKTCLVHDTIREFCQKKAGVDDQNLFQEICKSTSSEGLVPSFDVIKKSHRLSIHTHVKDFFLKKHKLPILRSFLCTFKEVINLEKKEIVCITDGFDLIRILDVGPIKFPSFPLKVLKLTRLRYLTLTTEPVKFLPDTLAQLCEMQTLTLNTMQKNLEVRANIWDMLKLRHFKTKSSIILINDNKKGKGGDNLQTLSRLSTVSCTAVVFNKAKNLKTLGISGDLNTLDSNCFENLKHLEKLKLMHDLDYRVACESPLKSFPQKLPLNIKFLTLSSTYLDWSQMSEVGKFSKLEVLKLKKNAFVGDCWDATAGGFLQLEFLCISQAQIQFWTASDGSFPKLRNLILKNCEKLEAVPNNLIQHLTLLSMEHVFSYAVRSARIFKKEQQEAQGDQKTNRGKLKLILGPGYADHV